MAAVPGESKSDATVKSESTATSPEDARVRLELAALRARREVQTLSDALKGEFEGTVATVRESSAASSESAERMQVLFHEVSTKTESAREDAGDAAENVEAVAAATNELNGSVSAIGVQVGRFATMAEGAAAEVETATNVIRSLAEAAGEINEVVKLIEGIAGQTNLLALNATIEAAHAGDAGRGFAVVAGEVKALAKKTAEATSDVAAKISQIQTVTGSAVNAINSIHDVIGEVKVFSEEAAVAVQQQISTVNEISKNSQSAASSMTDVQDAISDAALQMAEVESRASHQRDNAEKMQDGVEALQRRLSVALTESESIEDSCIHHVPVPLLAAFTVGGREYAGILHDLQAAGAVMESEDVELHVGDQLLLEVPGLGEINVRVERRFDNGHLLAFDDRPSDLIQDFIDQNIALDQPIIALAQRTARRISARFDQGVDNGEVTLEDLFDQDYRPIPNTNPQQYMTRFVKFTDSVLPEFQEPLLDSDPRIIFTAAVDRRGFLPTHNLKYNHAQRLEDPVWNVAHCRNRRIFDDRTGLAAGANTEAYFIQSYLRDMGGGKFVLMRDLTAPIMVKGVQWGNLRIGYKPD